MLAKYFSVIQNYVISLSSQRKDTFYHQNKLLDAFRTDSRNIIGRNPLMVNPLLANPDLTPMQRTIEGTFTINQLKCSQQTFGNFESTLCNPLKNCDLVMSSL